MCPRHYILKTCAAFSGTRIISWKHVQHSLELESYPENMCSIPWNYNHMLETCAESIPWKYNHILETCAESIPWKYNHILETCAESIPLKYNHILETCAESIP